MTLISAPNQGADQPHVTAEKTPQTAITERVEQVETTAETVLVSEVSEAETAVETEETVATESEFVTKETEGLYKACSPSVSLFTVSSLKIRKIMI